MIENYNFLFHYLEKEKITIDQKEFQFQFQSHPNYPSLLAISDTLSFFKINNLATEIEKEAVKYLPNNFIALIKEDKSNKFLAFIERTKKGFLYKQNDRTIKLTEEIFYEQFNDVVLLAEKEEDKDELKSKNSQKSLAFIFIFLGMIYLTSIFVTGFSMLPFIIVCFASIGIYLSAEAISHEFGIKTKFSETVCTITTNTDCGAVINSKKSNLFKFINFSDSSITFFGSQILALLLFTLSQQIVNFYAITTVLLLFSVPITFFSIYQQWFVAKKWCPICLAITASIYAELVCVLSFNTFHFSINFISIVYFLLAVTGSYLLVAFIKKIAKNNMELQSKVNNNNRFKRNYSLFKMALLASDKVSNKKIVSGNIIVGNSEAKLKITVVSSPFCGHCKAAHTIIEEIMERYKDKVSIDIRFNFNIDYASENAKIVHQRLVRLYFEKGQDVFLKALHNWFEDNDIDRLDCIEVSRWSDLKINEMLYEQILWNQDNKIAFTPSIIVNGYHFPTQYDRSDLMYFINDLEDDERF